MYAHTHTQRFFGTKIDPNPLMLRAGTIIVRFISNSIECRFDFSLDALTSSRHIINEIIFEGIMEKRDTDTTTSIVILTRFNHKLFVLDFSILFGLPRP